MKNRQWLLAQRPDGAIKDSDFKLVETDVPTPGAGEVLVRNLMLSCDPTQRVGSPIERTTSPIWTAGRYVSKAWDFGSFLCRLINIACGARRFPCFGIDGSVG